MDATRKDAVADSLGSLRAAGLTPGDDVRRIAIAWMDRRVSDTRLQRVERALVAGESLRPIVAAVEGADPSSSEDPAAGPEPDDAQRAPAPEPARSAGTGARPNIAGLRDPAALLRLEADLVHLRHVQLAARGVDGLFDLRHLQRLHLRLYGAVYWSAGDLRTTEVHRRGRRACAPAELADRGAAVFASVERGPVLRSMGRARVVERTADHLAALDALHPFAVGNACAARAFAGAWAARAGFRVAWADLDPAEALFADDAAASGTLEPARRLLEPLVRPLRDAPSARSPER